MPSKEFLKSEPLFDLIEFGLEENYYIYMADMTENFARFSSNIIEDFGMASNYIPNFVENMIHLIHPDDVAIFQEDFNRIITGESDIHECEYRTINKDGKYVWIRCKGRVKRKDGVPNLFCGCILNLGVKGRIDSVTGLMNLMTFQKDLLTLEGQREEVGFLILDIQNFSKYNQRYSYSFGSKILERFSKALLHLKPESASVYRLDNDRFVFVNPHTTRDQLKDLFEEIQTISQEGFTIDGIHIRFHVSGGAAFYPLNGKNTNILYRNLQYALLESKNTSRLNLTFFDDGMLDKSLHSIELMHSLHRSIVQSFNDFYLVYQPIVDGPSKKVLGCEALLRYKTEEFGNVYPSEFIPILETEESIISVGGWVIEESLVQLKKWQEIIPDFRMNINVSYVQFTDEGFVETVDRLMDKYKPKPGTVIFELTESFNVENPNELQETIGQIKKHGVQVALDDFGTGYSSLNTLRQIDTDIIKIDHKFVLQVKDNRVDQSLLKYIIRLCKKLNIKVCVEGIENEGILSTVDKYTPEYLQGYYFAKPCDKKTFETKFIS